MKRKRYRKTAARGRLECKQGRVSLPGSQHAPRQQLVYLLTARVFGIRQVWGSPDPSVLSRGNKRKVGRCTAKYHTHFKG